MSNYKIDKHFDRLNTLTTRGMRRVFVVALELLNNKANLVSKRTVRKLTILEPNTLK